MGNNPSGIRSAARCLRLLGHGHLKIREVPMSEQPPLGRQWTLLRTLCASHYGATVKELTVRCGCGTPKAAPSWPYAAGTKPW